MKKITFPGIITLFFVLLVSCSSKNSVKIFVSPQGNDNHLGTESAPFRTIQKAKSVVRHSLQKNPKRVISINFMSGFYHLDEPVVLTREDSGSDKYPVTYKAKNGETPVFTGSVEIKNWDVLSNPAKIKILAPGLEGKIYTANLKDAGITNFGDPTEKGKRPELYCNDKKQILARWPNEGFVKAGLVKGKTELPEAYIKKHGTKEGVFEYLDKKQNSWISENDIRLGGYWYWDWSDEYQTVSSIDTLLQTFYLNEPFHNYGYRDSLRYFGLNLFQEIDVPGEYYLDRTDGLLYWLPPEEIDPNQAKVTFSVFDAPYMVEMKNCSNIIIQGLSFQEGRGSAILIRDGENCLVADCRIERFGNDGIHIDGGKTHGISGCLLSTFDYGGIKIKGGGRKQLISANHFVSHSVVEYFSLFKRTYEPAVHAEGCGINISNNHFRFSSSSAMRLEGNDFLIEYNEISHVVNESDDQGGIDMYYNPSYQGVVIRYNRWSDIRGGTVHGAAGVRLDDMISGVSIFGNIFERCGHLHFGGVQIHGGKDNLVENNLFYNCHAAVSFTPYGEKRWIEQLDSPVMKKKLFEDVDIHSDLYQTKYPNLKNITKNVDINTIKNNLIVDCTHLFLRDNGKNNEENNTLIQAEGKDIEYLCSPEILSKYGLQLIPLRKIGPTKNKWINNPISVLKRKKLRS